MQLAITTCGLFGQALPARQKRFEPAPGYGRNWWRDVGTGEVFWRATDPNDDIKKPDVRHNAMIKEANQLDAAIDDAITTAFDAGELPILEGTARQEAMREVRNAMFLLPRHILRLLCKSRCKIIVEPVSHFESESIYLVGGHKAAGLTDGRVARIAGNADDIADVALHEVGHLVDNLFKPRLSSSTEWQAIHAAEAPKLDKKTSEHIFASEFFAESFFQFFSSKPFPLSNRVQKFIESI